MQKTICQVQTVVQAREAAAAGADVIIAQGRDAGGHSGMTRGTMGLVPAVVDAVAPIPVVAAGGHCRWSRHGGRAPRWVPPVSRWAPASLPQESLWDQTMKAATLVAGGDQTDLTRVFDVVRGAPWPARYPGRGLPHSGPIISD